MPASPPRHAWEWFSRQQLLWRHVRGDLASAPDPVGARYRLVEDRDDVMAHLRIDYPVDDVVATTVHRRIDGDIFLDRAERGLEGLGIRNAPRGLRWWWSAVTGRDDASIDPSGHAPREQLELRLDGSGDDQAALDEVRYGWGDR